MLSQTEALLHNRFIIVGRLSWARVKVIQITQQNLTSEVSLYGYWYIFSSLVTKSYSKMMNQNWVFKIFSFRTMLVSRRISIFLNWCSWLIARFYWTAGNQLLGNKTAMKRFRFCQKVENGYSQWLEFPSKLRLFRKQAVLRCSAFACIVGKMRSKIRRMPNLILIDESDMKFA